MINSRNIDDLRPDVAANCKIMLARCAAAGLPVLVTGTVRDKEYQEHCYSIGTAKTKTPSFHAQGVGLAFDICKNVKGQEYSDATFFARCAVIGKQMGFEWGGDWASFPDKPHFQWSGMNYSFTSTMILQGYYPPAMSPWKEEIDMVITDTTVKVGTQEVPAKLIDGVTYVPLRALVDTIKTALTVTWSEKDGAGVDMK
jgi:hypothetical protein